MSSTSKKRKATAPADGEGGLKKSLSTLPKEAPSIAHDVPGSPPTTPRLPPPVWGHVLDYMPYGEVRSALLISKMVANDAARYVSTLNITDNLQLDAPSAWRFKENTDCINILCLMKFTRETIEPTINDGWPWFHLSEDAVTRIVPFLSTFSSPTRVYLGALLPNGTKCNYGSGAGCGPSNHRSLFRSLLSNLLGGFRCRSLPASLKEISGIRDSFGEVRNCHGSGNDCDFCLGICEHFPIKNLIYTAYEYFGNYAYEVEPQEWSLCLTKEEIFECLQSRNGWTECVEEMGVEFLLQVVQGYISAIHLFEFEGDEKDSILRRSLIKSGVCLDEDFEGIRYFGWDDLETLDYYITLGFDPKKVCKRKLYKALQLDEDGLRYNVFDRGTVDILKSRGFSIDETDLLIFDHTKDIDLESFSDIMCSYKPFPYSWD